MEGSAAARDQRLAIGAVLGGKYKVLGLLGQGRMGRVLLAQHKDLKVVLKVLAGALGSDREVVARFTREGRAAMELRGEHVARVTEVGVLPDIGPYLAMEYLEGQTLAQLLKKGGPLPPSEAIGYLLEVIEAVSEGHFQKIIHKNLTPANLFLVQRSDGSAKIKVVDFGMSTIDAMTDSATQRKEDKEGNSASVYMSPEQSKGGVALDARADVWSLGVVLYELLTGELPFDTATLGATGANPKSARSVRDDLPEQLDAIITRCLQRDIGLRYASVRDLGQALEAFASIAHSVEETDQPSGKEKIITMPGVAPPAGAATATSPKIPPTPALPSSVDDDLAWEAEPTVPPFVQGPSPAAVAPAFVAKPQPPVAPKPAAAAPAKPLVPAKPQPSPPAPVVAKTGTSPHAPVTAPKAQPSSPGPMAPKAAAPAAPVPAPRAQPSAPGPIAPKAAVPTAPKAARTRAATLVGIAPPVIPVVASAPRQEPQAYEEGAVIADRYDLVRLIGKGGFGQVWMAKSRALDSMVALKLFVRAGTDIDGGAERLLAEARAAAQLEHPAIVRVFDFGETSRGDPFLVMELLRGESLEDVLERQGPMNPSRLAAILLPIVDALGTAHAKGIIHRDIKPANLFLGRSESRRSKPDSLGSVWLQPKVIDFGLVKRHEEGQLKITQEGALAGSPAYMSPEQVKGVKVDARTDIWSLSVVMYELLTNRMPFPVTSQYELFKALVERDPEPIVEHVDAGLVAIVMRGLAKPVDARWSSMHELGMELAEWLDGQGVKVDVSGASIRATWLDAHIPVSIVPPSMPSPTSPKVPALVTTQDRPAPAKSAGEMDALWRNVAAGVVAEPDAEELDAIEVEEILPLPIVEVAQAEPQAVAASVAPGATIIIKTPIVARASVQPPPRARPLLGMAIGALLTLGAGLAFIYVRGLPKEQSVSTPPTTPVSTPVAISATPVTTAAPTPTDTPSAATTPTSTPVVVDVPPPVPTPPVPSAHPSTKASAAVKPPPSSTAHVRPPVTTHPTAKPSATAKPDKELGF